MKTVSISVFCIALIVGAFLWPVSAQEPAEKKESSRESSQELKTEDERTIYAIGLALGRNVGSFGLTEAELKILFRGFSDSVLGQKKLVSLEEYMPKIQAFAGARAKLAGERAKAGAAKFLKAEAAKPGAVTTKSGLVFTELKAGTGASPKATDTVTVHYHGTLADGTVFDSSVDRGEPASFPLNGVIKAWTEGLQLMKVGGKARLVCPSDIAYGDRGSPPKIAPGVALVFEVELISIQGQNPK